MNFHKVDPQQNFPELEQDILKFWQENKIFEKSVEKNSEGKKFVFYEGPPTANGRPGIHHVLARSFKDIICRYQTMQGKLVARRAGWDTHGLPVEIEVEKQLGLKNKKEVEEFGIAEFNAKCRESVWSYKEEWEKLTERIAYWVDLKNPYITYENSYIEKVWGILKQIWDKKFLYEGYKVVPYCPRCGTPLSSHEVAQGYKTIEESSVFVKFPVKNEKNKFFLVWTTTPWTLPGNAALAVGSDFDYIEAKVADETYILVKDRAIKVLGNFETIKEMKGKDLVGLGYEPLYEQAEKTDLDYKVWAADFVSTEDGTGIVHIAPAFGLDDMGLRDRNKFSVFVTVDTAGKMLTETGNGKFVKDADSDVKTDLKERNLFFKEETVKHEYPFCWRCDSILIYLARSSWFIDMSKVRQDLVKNNESINWVPAYIKQGRFGEWLKDAKDWALSRERFWGTPLPLWKCDCGQIQAIGSIDELRQKAVGDIPVDLDLHRPYIDEVKIKCDSCGQEAKRVPELIDVWFDSGAMPFASGEFPENYPADFISEAIDQTRGWFYTLLAISTLLDQGASFKNVICLGHVLDEHGKKMSKSKGNIIVPSEVIDKFGADSVRWFFYTVNNPGEPKRMSVRDVEVTFRRFVMTLWNVYAFFITYASLDQFKPQTDSLPKSENKLDQWVLSYFNRLVKDVTKNLDDFDVVGAARLIQEFSVELSTWYLRRSRKRRDNDFYETLYFVLLNLVKIIAPFTPFVAESIYQNLNKDGAESVHLATWPDAKEIDEKILVEMQKVRSLVEKAHALRGEAKIRVRQPLASATIKVGLGAELEAILQDEINVKKIQIDKNTQEIELDTKITSELQEEGDYRDLVRLVQDLRKKQGLKPGEEISLQYNESFPLKNIIEKFSKELQEETTLSAVKQGENNDQQIWLGD